MPSSTRRNIDGRTPFEGVCAQIVADFANKFDTKRERCWIAEMDGENVGCIFLAKDSATVARIRLLLVDPKARGLGLGARLVDECLRFARRAGYKKITLWTHSVLTAARHIYEKAGFKLMRSERHEELGAARWSASTGIWSCDRHSGATSEARNPESIITASRNCGIGLSEISLFVIMDSGPAGFARVPE